MVRLPFSTTQSCRGEQSRCGAEHRAEGGGSVSRGARSQPLNPHNRGQLNRPTDGLCQTLCQTLCGRPGPERPPAATVTFSSSPPGTAVAGKCRQLGKRSRVEASELASVSLSHCGPWFLCLFNRDNLPSASPAEEGPAAVQSSERDVPRDSDRVIDTLLPPSSAPPEQEGVLQLLTRVGNSLPEQSVIPLLGNWDLIMYSFRLCHRRLHATEQPTIN